MLPMSDPFALLMTTDGENEVASMKKFVSATKKCGAILDQWLPDDVKTRYHVLVLVCAHCYP